MFNRDIFFENAKDVMDKIYANRSAESVKARYNAAFDEFEAIYGEADALSVFSVAGRSEICGNHTDHNYGKVLAASIDLDIIAVAAKNADSAKQAATTTLVRPVRPPAPIPAALST